MAGSASTALRSAFVTETTQGTTVATPAFKTLHEPILFTDAQKRMGQPSLVAGGALVGDSLLYREYVGKISAAPVVYGLYDTFFESLFQAAFSSNVLNDGKAASFFTVENTIPNGVGGASKMKRYTGVEAVGGSIAVDARGGVTMDMDFIGISGIGYTGTAIVGSTYTDPSNNDPFSATTDVGAVTFAGMTLDDIASAKIDFTYDGKVPQPKVGTDDLVGIARGAYQPIITLKCYVGTNYSTNSDAARAQTQTAAKVTVNMGSITLKKYKWEFNLCYLDSAMSDFSGANGFITLVLRANYSTSTSSVMTLTRAVV